MELSLAQLAELVGGSLEGPADRVVSGVNGIDKAGPSELTFLSNPKYTSALKDCRAGVILVSRDQEVPQGLAVIRVDDPYLSFARVLAMATQRPYVPIGVHPKAVVDQTVQIGTDVSVHALAYVGPGAALGDRVILHPGVYVGEGVSIGADTVLHPNVTINRGCIIGKRCIIHSGSVIGADGYGFVRQEGGHVKIPQVGIVQIDDDVELGANNTVDRAVMGRTWIKAGAKTDNLVHIAHNCVIGERTLLVAQVGISGSTEVGDDVVMGGQVGVAGHLKIGNRVQIGAQSGIPADIPDGEVMSGYPVMPHRLWLRTSLLTRKLPLLFDKVKALEKRLAKLDGSKDKGL